MMDRDIESTQVTRSSFYSNMRTEKKQCQYTLYDKISKVIVKPYFWLPNIRVVFAKVNIFYCYCHDVSSKTRIIFNIFVILMSPGVLI